jgi:hypothetical protein
MAAVVTICKTATTVGDAFEFITRIVIGFVSRHATRKVRKSLDFYIGLVGEQMTG